MASRGLVMAVTGPSIALMVLMGMFSSVVPSEARAGTCASSAWNYSEASLQEARRRLKSPGFKSVASRVECGMEVSTALAVEQPVEDCPACQREYIGFAQDLILFTRQAAEKSASQKNKEAYYKSEIDLRIALGTFLVETKDQALIDKHWSKNFDGMGDVMEMAKLGRRFHEEAVGARGHVLSDKSFKTWARAIRSCESWDFIRGQNRDLPGLRRVLLCAEECKRALVRIRQRAQSGQAIDKEATMEILDDLLPALDNCPVEPTP